MAIGEFYSVPEIDLRTATPKVFGSCICARRSMEKARWLGQKCEDLARRGPEELPPCFLAVGADAPSPRTGLVTEQGRWEPKEVFASPGVLAYKILRKSTTPGITVNMWVRTKLVYHPNDDSKSDLAMTMYNVVSVNSKGALLEEDIALCRVFRVPKGKGKDVVQSEPWRFGFEFNAVHEFPKHDSDLDVADFPDLDVVAEFLDLDVGGNSAGDWDLLSIDSSGGTKKRPRSNTKAAGGSEVWHSFIKIYTKDPEVVYAACIHCGRMMKLKGGSKCGTKSLSRHNETCPCKPGSSVDTLH